MIRKVIEIALVIAAIGWFIKPGNAALAGHVAHNAVNAVSALVTALLS